MRAAAAAGSLTQHRADDDNVVAAGRGRVALSGRVARLLRIAGLVLFLAVMLAPLSGLQAQNPDGIGSSSSFSGGGDGMPGGSAGEDFIPDRLRSENGLTEIWFYPCRYRPPSTLIPFVEQYVNGDIRADANNTRIIIRDRVERMALISRILRLLDTPPRQVLCQVKIVTLNYSNDFQFGSESDWDVGGKTSGNQELFFRGYSLSFLPDDYLAALQANPNDLQAAADDFTGTSVFFDALGDTQARLGNLDITIRTLQASNRATIVAQPSVVVERGYPATIEAGQEVPISIREFVQNGVPFVKTTYEPVGNSVQITPREIGDDTVRLDVRPTTSRVSRFFDSGSGISNPIIQSTSAQTTVTMRSGETLELGGLRSTRTLTTETGVPLLMDIPILGYLFRATNREYQRRDVVFFITPLIFRRYDAAMAAEVASRLAEEAELVGRSRGGGTPIPTGDDDNSGE